MPRAVSCSPNAPRWRRRCSRRAGSPWRVYTTKPEGALFFPQFTVATADLGTIDIPPPTPGRERAAPTRSRTRTQNRAYRIAHERAHNRAAIDAHPPPF
ncbi:hypothetical protein [Mycolicibacterium neoaurum]|uniref:hypothetical protein n=1 Tax=Mycolicibacterium neoaurum TaxID=1795 RepID=UPI0005A760BC|nr:hypothetical protein [Mycolicibacterium neoaurum]